MEINPKLTRELVSYQGSKKQAFYRWLKFKEAFSSDLIKHFLELYSPSNAKDPSILDPFAGTGTALTVAANAGWKATGIEIMPIGVAAIKARLVASKINTVKFNRVYKKFKTTNFYSNNNSKAKIGYLTITKGAFHLKTELALINYLDFLAKIKDDDIRYIFWFACLSILEDISYTRKDGQYLRWDCRSDRKLKSQFNKGQISQFHDALDQKLNIIIEDIRMYKDSKNINSIKVIEGSCLDEIPLMTKDKFNLIITSPPYCNRYDYTRTYALELAFMGKDDEAVKDLRQCMLSCTVENKSKKQAFEDYYNRKGDGRAFKEIQRRFDNQKELKEIIQNLINARDEDKLNNNNIPNLVENYFYELNVLIGEFYRILKPGGRVIMVNDNVQYNGDEIPVDLILSDFASMAGFTIEHIWILPNGKGNSSQQMGVHGRNELRKCVYVWQKK